MASDVADDPATPPPTRLDDELRARIRHWLSNFDMTQAELAARLGRNQAWMSRYLGGESDIDLDTAQRIAAVFEHTLASALDLPADPHEARLTAAFRALPPSQRQLVLTLADQLARPHRARRRARRPQPT